MATAQDYTKAFNDMMSAFPIDTSAFTEAFRAQAELGERMSNVALQAAEKSTEISSNWTKTTLSRMGNVTRVKEDPADYSKAMSEFASASAETASENLAAFAEVAKKVQMDTVEIMMAAGKTFSEEVNTATRKATDQAASAAKKPVNATAK
ncbi:phasin, PhaP [Brevirhabdus pacifica]|uniref:Phasin, PhaP n=1 Tax=Brevirhabdus pacifica TaxID=1267768 RepID=A0A1U7DG37_9RHOB|nr:phasin, PhaP [Brevirhabdus pacifica]APX88926.1 phasin, PhaP [Brevirhabdus pacifica]OWU80154.1 hypothetical protein ATO5_04290 [Loktanella sp. 22II-4b]PJJ86524.1 phasin protein [Brevirhabdus pacifica]